MGCIRTVRAEQVRDERCPEAALADRLREQGRTLALIPDAHPPRRAIAEAGRCPARAAAPRCPADVGKGRKADGLALYALTALAGAAAGAAILLALGG